MHVFMLLQICWTEMLNRKNLTWKNVKGKIIENNFLTLCKTHLQPFGTKTGGKLLRREKEEWGGSRAQSIPQMKSKRQSVRHKHACHPWELAGGWWLIRFLLSLFLCKWERSRKKRKWERERAREEKRERGRHLYCIGLDAMMPVKLMSQLPREGRGQE